MKRNSIYKLAAYILIILCSSGCDKDFLEKKPDQALVVPSTLQDFQALLDNVNSNITQCPALNIVAGDEFFTSSTNFRLLERYEQQSYTWADDIFGAQPGYDWDAPYHAIFVANVVLEGVEKIASTTDVAGRNAIRGGALFWRAMALYVLAQQFTVMYKPETAAAELGIPIRLTADINALAGRGRLDQVYQQILKDLKEAYELLPSTVTHKHRPGKPAALGLLARVYLNMQDYTNAEKYANEYLKDNNALLDFNTIDVSAARPFGSLVSSPNPEVQYFCGLLGYLYFYAPYGQVDTTVYASYDDNDLRKEAYFNRLTDGSIGFKGSYIGDFGFFCGIATDEVYLIRAECYARQDKTAEALADLNRLRINRWATQAYVPATAATAREALKLILEEVKKELFARGLRWSYLRRLNLDPEFQVTIKHVIDGQEYLLPPNSPRYVFPIPPNEVAASGIEQNKR